MNSKYYTEEDFACKGDSEASIEEHGHACGCNFSVGENGIDDNLIRVLDAASDYVGQKLNLSCAYRCPIHNEDVGGEVGSFHTKGMAADVICPEGMSEIELENIMMASGADTAVAYVGEGFVHTDMRGYRAYW